MLARRSVLTSVAPLLLTLAAGCDEDVAFYIYHNQVPAPGCSVTAADSGAYRPQGLLDVSLGVGYELFPLLRNELPARKAASSFNVEADPNVLHLREFRVRIDLAGVSQTVDRGLLDYPFPASGTLYPGERRASRVKIIPDQLARDIDLPSGASPTVIVEIVARADSADGAVESVPFYYPVELCDGCLVTILDSCPSTGPLNQGNECGLPQDAALVCCKDPQLGLVCPGPGGPGGES